jgi:hypothetical protein
MTQVTVLQDILHVLRRSEPATGLPINIGQTQITIATINRPVDANVIANAAAGQPGYDIISVFNSVHRVANVFLINDGPGTLFFVMSPDGQNWTGESEILIHEFRFITAAWQINIRSPNAATNYRVSEFLPGFLA